MRPRCDCPCCVVYGPRRAENREAIREKARLEVAIWSRTKEGIEALRELRETMLIQEGKRQLGRALQALLESHE